VRGQVVQVAWYRFWATFGRRWGGYLSIVLLIGLTGGIGMGSIAAARRTQSSFSTFLASTNPSDMNLNSACGPNLTKDLSHLPGVERVEAAIGLTAFSLGQTGAPIIGPPCLSGEVSTLGNINGEYFDQDRVTVTQGRMADPKRADEFVATALAEQLLGLGDPTSVPRRQCNRAAQRRKLAGSVGVPPLFVKHRFSVLGKGVPALKLTESVSKLGA